MILRAAAAMLALLTSGAAAGCGARMPAEQVRVPSIPIGSLQTAINVSSVAGGNWTVSWFGGSDADNVAFRARLVDISGGTLSASSGTWTQVVQPAANELDATGFFYALEAPVGGILTFQSTGAIVAFRIERAAPYLINYITADQQERFVSGNDFALSDGPVVPDLRDPFEDVFCSTFERY